MTQENLTATAAVSIVGAVTAELLGECAGLFARVESPRLAADAVAGLQADLKTKNCWSLAKNAGHADPWRLQHIFNDGAWDEDAVRERAAGAALSLSQLAGFSPATDFRRCIAETLLITACRFSTGSRIATIAF